MTTSVSNHFAPGAIGGKHDSDGRELQRALRASVSQALDVRSRGHGLQGMVIAIRDALANGEQADELAAKVDGALDAASKHLAEQGYSQDQIDAAISRFRDRLTREIDELASKNAPAAGGEAATTGAAQRVAVAEAAREVKRERLSLDILTAEGDKVSIRFKSLQITDAAAAQVTQGDATATAVEGSVISRGRFKIEVDGDLNDAERAAIGDLLDKVDGIAKDFFGGDVQAAFAAASRVGLESDALSAFSLRMSYSRSVAASAYASTAALGGTAAPHSPSTPAVPAPAPTPAAPVPAGPLSPSTPETSAPLPSVPSDSPAKVADVVAPAPAAETTTVAPSASRTIASFTKDVLARLSTAGENGTVQFSLRWKVEFLVSALSSVAPTPAQDPAAQPAVEALGQSLGSETA